MGGCERRFKRVGFGFGWFGVLWCLGRLKVPGRVLQGYRRVGGQLQLILWIRIVGHLKAMWRG